LGITCVNKIVIFLVIVLASFKKAKNSLGKSFCRNPGLNKGTSDLQSASLPLELIREVLYLVRTYFEVCCPFQIAC
jgi:hypothetical protein